VSVRRGGPPSRSVLYLRRLIALVILAGGLALAGWAAARAVRAVEGDPPPPPPAPTQAAKPPPKVLRIVFPEGFTRRQMAARITAVNRIARTKRNVRPRLRASRYLKLTASGQVPAGFPEARGRSLEGFLFPATYEFLGSTTTKQLVARQLTAFGRNWAKVDLRYARSKNLTPYDVLIIASMVERETVAPDERPLVASVIYNRLKAGMPLGIDATIRYGLNVPATQSLRRSQLEGDHPYNTRTRTGLTPTPIANPGLASIQAAAHPARTKYLFFVRKPDKVHHFFTTSESAFYAYLGRHGYGNG
jgi:peptidoglycan lytic transglycosylase G